MSNLSNFNTLVRAFNLQNVSVPNVTSSQYNAGTVQKGFVTPDAKLRDSVLGTPVLVDLTLLGGSYQDTITGETVTFPELVFDAVIATVNFPVNIVKQAIQGRPGTVKEYISEDDAVILIQGVITGANGVYPYDEVQRLNQWRKAPVTKGVVSKFLQNLGITDLVVEDCSIPQVAGGYSYQQFTINCISDRPVELKISTNV